MSYVFCSIGEKYEKKVDMMSTALGNLKAYDQRLSFAVGRLDMLKGLCVSFASGGFPSFKIVKNIKGKLIQFREILKFLLKVS